MQEYVDIVHASTSAARVCLFGATVTSFRTGGVEARDVLFFSRFAVTDGSKPLRGGIPIVFPQFGGG